eukprot:c249_g1_i1 orf=112-1644(+)
MALRVQPLAGCGYGGRQCAEMGCYRVSNSGLQMSFCASMRNALLKKQKEQEQQQQQQMMGLKKAGRPVITAVIKRRKDYPLDNVIQRQKKLKLVTTIKDLLIKQPGMVMSLKHLGKYRKKLNLDGRRRVVALLKKYPAIFDVFEEGVNSLYFRLTQEAEDQILEEKRLKLDMESSIVNKIRKMLMMSVDKTLLVSKIDHLKKDLGLPDDFRDSMIGKYPEFFKVIEKEGGLTLELTAWDPELAISTWEKKQQSAPQEEETISGRPRRFVKVDLPRGYSLKRKDKEVIKRFQEIPYISPYADFAHYKPGSKEYEKHACAVVHELLSLMLEKRTLVDHLTHFRKDYKFSQQLHGMLIRHPEIFYVSLKGTRDCVFLREAYQGSELIQKDPLVIVKERLAQLVALDYRNIHRRNIGSTSVGEDDDADDDDEEDDDDDYDEGEDDGWSDDDDVYDNVPDESKGWPKEARSPRERQPRVRDQWVKEPQREPRRAPSVVRREAAMAARESTPREIW